MEILVEVLEPFFQAALPCFQTSAPWPSKTPCPDNVKEFIYWNLTHWSDPFWTRFMSEGAWIVPSTWISIGALQGPLTSIPVNIYVPAGITILVGVGDAHAKVQAFMKALRKQSIKCVKYLLSGKKCAKH